MPGGGEYFIIALPSPPKVDCNITNGQSVLAMRDSCGDSMTAAPPRGSYRLKKTAINPPT